MDDAFKARLKKQLALVQPGKGALHFLVAIVAPDPIVLVGKKKIELSTFASATKAAYVLTPPAPAVVAVGRVSVESGALLFEVGDGGKGQITHHQLQIDLRALGVAAGVNALTICEVRALPEDGATAPDLDDVRRELCLGDGGRLGRLSLAFGGPEKLLAAVRAAGGPAVVGPFARNLFLDAPADLAAFLQAAAGLPLAAIAAGWKESLP